MPANPTENTSSSRRIAGATGIMMVAIAVSRILGLVRDAVISGKFGQGYWSDVYYVAFVLPDFLFFLIAGGALSSAFIPVFTEKVTNGKEDEAWHVFSTVACVMFVVVSIFILLGEIFTAPLVDVLAGGFPRSQIADTVPLTRIILPAQICFFLGGLMMGAQYAKNKFVVPALGPIVYNLGIILGGVFLANYLGVRGLCWGALVGAVAGNFFLQLWSLKRIGMKFHISFDYKHPDVMQVWKLMLPVILGLALPQVSIQLNKMFATGLGHGPVSALTRANMLMQVPLGVFAQAMGVAIFPTLSALAARKRYDDMRTTASMGIRSLLYLTIPSSALMMALSVPIIQLLLQHGKFHASDTFLAASVLVYYSIGIFAWSAQSVLARGFYALQDTVTPVVIGTGVTLLFVPMSWIFMRPLGWGAEGLALATTVAAILHMMLMMVVLRRKLNGIEGGRMLLSFGKITAASVVAGGACWKVYSLLAHHFGPTGTVRAVKVHALETLIVGAVVGLAVFLVLSIILRIEEMHQIRGLLVKRRKPVVVVD